VGSIDTMLDLPPSPHPNMVTKRRLPPIDSALEAARRGFALDAGDREVLVKAGSRSLIL
jgi:hypothetical protein